LLKPSAGETELHINALVRPLHIRFLLRRRTNPRAEIEQSHTGNTAQAQLKVARTIADLGGDADAECPNWNYAIARSRLHYGPKHFAPFAGDFVLVLGGPSGSAQPSRSRARCSVESSANQFGREIVRPIEAEAAIAYLAEQPVCISLRAWGLVEVRA